MGSGVQCMIVQKKAPPPYNIVNQEQSDTSHLDQEVAVCVWQISLMHMSSHVWASVVSILCLLLFSLSRASTFSFTVILINFPVIGAAEEWNHCTYAQWGVLPRNDIQPSHRLWAQRTRRLPSLRNFCSDLPGWIRRHRYSTMSLPEKRYLHHCSSRGEKNQRTWDKLITLMRNVCCQLSHFSHTQVRRDLYTNLVRLKKQNQVATWKAKESGFSLTDKKRASSRWFQNRDTETRISSRFWQEKYSGVEWNYRVWAKRNWSYSCRRWTTSTRSTTTSWTIIRTKSGSSWNGLAFRQDLEKNGKNAGWLGTWDCPLRTDSASLKTLESFK